MDAHLNLPLLGGLTPAQFMRRHWQKKPLVVRQALADWGALPTRTQLFALAADEQVEARLIQQKSGTWSLAHGPFARRQLPPLSQGAWTLLVQGLDLHSPAANELLQRFRFVPDARLDDVMVSFATPGGGVGPHFDSYDVFLLQTSGQRLWRIGRQSDLSLQSDVPLKLLKNFQPSEEFLLNAGDMLYLPPMYAHDGVAQDCGQDCITYSIGFRAPERMGLAADLLQKMADYAQDSAEGQADKSRQIYRDPAQLATEAPGEVPSGLGKFARAAFQHALSDPLALECALGEVLTEAKRSVWFEAPPSEWPDGQKIEFIQLDQRSKMMYDAHHIFINGEAFLAKGADARLMRQLANERSLNVVALRKASREALALLLDWHEAGWLLASAAAAAEFSETT
jgi:50S ribosomal protein L16 3-hydroxylase